MSTPSLRLVVGGRAVDLVDGRAYVVGQAATADIRIVHGSIAEQHARLTVAAGVLTVESLAPDALVSVAGQLLQSAKLTPDVDLVFGAVTARLVGHGVLAAASRGMRPGPREATFQEVMARELARTPWFLLSMALHALILLALSWLYQKATPGQAALAPVQMLGVEEPADIATDAHDDVRVEVEKELKEQAAADPEPQLRTTPEPAPAPEPLFVADVPGNDFDAIGLSATVGTKSGGSGGHSPGEDILNLGSEALRKGGLSRSVAKLRESGLEIVFVFDSTGSMDGVLLAAKQRIFRMVEVLHALVPTARIGIVTFRDHGNAEDYVTRALPVTLDVYRVMNFMHGIDARGGGDFEEAVFDALKVATGQRWLSRSQRVVVLIGDAPPHRQDEAALQNLVRAFCRDRAVVHTIATTEARRGQRHPDANTRRTFEAIAKDGKGQFALLEQEDTILKQVLALAFGSEYRKDLDEVYDLVDKRTQRTAVAALDAVQRADLAAIERALRKNPVDDEIVKALIALKNPDATRFLIERLGDAAFPAHARQAAAFALMHGLGLNRPPLDPESDAPLAQREVEALLRRLPR